MVQNNLIEAGNLKNINHGLYSNLTITPGFPPFDDIFPNFGNHFFVLNKSKISFELPDKYLYIYMRNIFFLNKILNIAKTINKSVFNIDTDLNAPFVDLWKSKPYCKILISHGGHGICTWAAMNNIFHLVIPDNDDRMSNAKRIKKLGLGDYLDTNDIEIEHKLKNYT
ncbi:MAG: hypothetical protein IPL20_03165 [Saprospiraceae bacterium]|nr:hypothetical protein [Saprospiraceae bacterium]